MTASTRRERVRESTRSAIIAAALDLLEGGSATAVTIRRVADAVDYSAPVVYQHFDDKDALLIALIELGFDDLRARLDAAIADGAADDRLIAAARAYLAFAAERPELYLLMNDAGIDSAERERAASAVVARTVRLAEDWLAAHPSPRVDAVELSELLWSALHGTASLGRLRALGHDHAARLGERSVALLLDGLAAEADAANDAI